MKKLFWMIAALITISTAAFAQTAPAAQVKTTTSSHKATSHTTKSGAPDKRFKENKTATSTTVKAGPLKKDGTADMRYNANKTTTVKKTKTTK